MVNFVPLRKIYYKEANDAADKLRYFIKVVYAFQKSCLFYVVIFFFCFKVDNCVDGALSVPGIINFCRLLVLLILSFLFTGCFR